MPIKSLKKFISQSTSPYHIVNNCKKMLQDNGFNELDFTSDWNLKKGSSYFTCPYGTTLFSFTIGNDFDSNSLIRMASAHTDYPCFRVKPNAELTEKSYLKLNVEAYGGVILNTWLDRPLSIAGKVSLKSKNLFSPNTQLIDFKSPLLIIPNLAIHINRQVNKGIELNKQTDMEPLLGLLTDKSDKNSFFKDLLAKELSVSKDDILDYDLYIYVCENGSTVGMNDEFFSAPRLDNLTSTFALVKGIISARTTSGSNLSIIALYDNEEIGSRSKQGADSNLSSILLEKIYNSLGLERIDLLNSLMKGIHFSVDVSHCLHPNHLAKNDPTNIVELNKGVVLKIDSTQKYSYDTEGIAIAQQLCEYYKIPYQKFANRSDATSGSTLGSISSSWMPMKTVDLGISLLAMHSARELMGSKDQTYLEELLEKFFSHI